MKVNLGNMQREGTREGQGSTFIAANIKKEAVMLDRYGNEIDRRTKQIINKNEDK